MLPPDELRILFVLAFLFTVPGWFILSITGVARQWTALQRWCLVIALSIAFFPVFMYFLRLIPGFRMGVNKWIALLAVLVLIAGWNLRKSWRSMVQFDTLGWLAIAILGMTLFTRFWAAHLNPYPAWTDSLHHTLITQLAAQYGRLPDTLEPYAPTPLSMYHLGLYSISSVVMLLARVPAHSALLWTAQALNGLCGLGVFLVLDRKVGRVGAVAGAAVVGLFSFQPAWYVNWGRFTQVSSQTILPVAWLATWETICLWREGTSQYRRLVGMAVIGALLTASVFLLHYRVAYFYLPLLALTLLLEFRQAVLTKTSGRFFLALAAVGLLSLGLISPALFSALQDYILQATHPAASMAAGSAASASNPYYEFPISSIFTIGAQPWLLVAGLLSAVYNLYHRSIFSWLMLGWVVALILEGLTYLLKIPLLNVTNMGAILIMLYLPLGFIIGQAIEVGSRERYFTSPRVRQMIIAGFLAAVFLASHIRVGSTEAYRYFLTNKDVAAMHWIKANTPSDALFAINTYFWLPSAPHGSDGGYWLPYFADRKTTAGTMLFSAGPEAYKQAVLRQSLAVENLKNDYTAIDSLCREGVTHVYLGDNGDFLGHGLDPVLLQTESGARLIYQQGGVFVFEICQN